MNNSKFLNEACTVINEEITDASAGLGDEVFKTVSRLTPLVNVDLLVRSDFGGFLLAWREDEYYGPGWHLPGGIIRFKEFAKNRVKLVALKELGCEVNLIHPKPLEINELMAPNRDIRGHFISLLYYCSFVGDAPGKPLTLDKRAKHGAWRWFREIPTNLIPQHVCYIPTLEKMLDGRL